MRGWLIPKPGVLHVVMEKADSDVTTALQQSLPLKFRMKIALDVINGLTAIHSAQTAHQDIKVDSILVSQGQFDNNLFEFFCRKFFFGSPKENMTIFRKFS